MRAGISLGSNLGNRATHLDSAISAIRQLADPTGPFLISSFRETSPVDCPPDSPTFLNAAIEIEWNASPHELLERLQSIERAQGRPKIRPINSPRPLDLDLLYCGDHVIKDETLTLPHPRLTERTFVLEPLAELNPNLFLPNHTESIAELLFFLVRN